MNLKPGAKAAGPHQPPHDSTRTIYVLAPETENVQPAPADAHTMNPDTVLRMARTLGTLPEQILLG